MKIKETGIAGTTDKNDCKVTISKGNGSVEIHLKSKVIYEYGEHIKEVISNELEKLNISDALVNVEDMGAFDHIIKARLEAAIYRSQKIDRNIPWGELIK